MSFFRRLSHAEHTDHAQVTTFWEKVLSPTDREHLTANIVRQLKNGVTPEMVQRVLEYWGKVHPDLRAGIEQGMGLRTPVGTGD